MVILSIYSELQLQNLIEKYNGFRTANEYGTSAFWNWYYQIMGYAKSLDAVCEQECEYNVYKYIILSR